MYTQGRPEVTTDQCKVPTFFLDKIYIVPINHIIIRQIANRPKECPSDLNSGGVAFPSQASLYIHARVSAHTINFIVYFPIYHLGI